MTEFQTDYPETPHFGLTRVGEGEALSKNGWSALDSDRQVIDALLWALANHSHDGAAQLGDPSDLPELSALTDGGDLPASTTFFYRIAYLDRFGLETGASPEAAIATIDPLDEPTAPAATVTPGGGTISPGSYSYMITYLDAQGGETTPSDVNTVKVAIGSNSIDLTMPGLVDGAVSYNIYRARPGQTAFYFLANTTAGTFSDTGLAEDATIIAPLANTTNETNSIQVTTPGGYLPPGVKAWRIYRATSSGQYDGYSLVHQVSEGSTEDSNVPVSVWTDTGDALQAGFPQNKSTTLPGTPVVSSGSGGGGSSSTATPQCFTAFAPGVVSNAQLVSASELFATVQPTRLTAFFKTDVSAGSTVRVRAECGSQYAELHCDTTTARVGDPVGYYRTSGGLTALGPGTLKVTVYVDNGPTMAADVNVALWF